LIEMRDSCTVFMTENQYSTGADGELR